MDPAPTPIALCAHRETEQTSFGRHGSPTTTMKAELKIRQTTSAIGTNTCGWINGDPISSVTCPSQYGCGVISTAVGCLPTAIYTTCYDLLGPTCDQSCQNVLANLYCGNDYCAQFDYPSGSVGYGCATISGNTYNVLLTTTTMSTSSLDVGVSGASSSSSSSSTTSTPNSSPTPEPSASSNSLSSGAIAGIVIGSVAVIVFICGLFFMVYVHRKKQRQTREGVSKESVSLDPSSNGPSSPTPNSVGLSPQTHPHHLSGSTFYDNVSPPFNPGDGPWSTPSGTIQSKAPKPPEELEADFPYEKDASTSEYDPRSSNRYSAPSTESGFRS